MRAAEVKLAQAEREAYEFGRAAGYNEGWWKLYGDLDQTLAERRAVVHEVTQADLDLVAKRRLH